LKPEPDEETGETLEYKCIIVVGGIMRSQHPGLLPCTKQKLSNPNV
jgi:hypothetical protein